VASSDSEAVRGGGGRNLWQYSVAVTVPRNCAAQRHSWAAV